MDINKNQMKVQQFEGCILKDTHLVGRVIGKGNFGTVHEVIDAKTQSSGQYAIKASEDVIMLYNEVRVLESVHEFAQKESGYREVVKSIPQNLDYGIVLKEKSEKSSSCNTDEDEKSKMENDINKNGDADKSRYVNLVYFIMPRYGQNLMQIVEARGQQLSNASVFGLGLKLLNILELIHASGHIYNDLKPENIMLGRKERIPNQSKYPNENLFKNVNLHLIDFGLATTWLNKKLGKHCDPKTQLYFQGNLYFSSVNLLSCRTSSRRDDLHSWVYLMIYLLNKCAIPCIDAVLLKQIDNVHESLDQVLKIKKEYTLAQMCIGRAISLERLGREIDTLEFSTVPNYDKLRSILHELLQGAKPHRQKQLPQLCLSPRQGALHSRNSQLREYHRDCHYKNSNGVQVLVTPKCDTEDWLKVTIQTTVSTQEQSK